VPFISLTVAFLGDLEHPLFAFLAGFFPAGLVLLGGLVALFVVSDGKGHGCKTAKGECQDQRTHVAYLGMFVDCAMTATNGSRFHRLAAEE
jgi:hypothetical protein